MSRKGYHVGDQYGVYFLTFTVVGWADIFTRPECRDTIIDSLKYCKKNKGLILYAYVIMSNHLHLIVSAHPASEGVSVFIRDFKKFTARELIKWFSTSRKESRREWVTTLMKEYGAKNSDNEIFQVWKSDNHPMQIVSPKFARQKLAYIHMNPVKAGIVDSTEDYLYSSARNYAGRNDYIVEVELLDLVFTLSK